MIVLTHFKESRVFAICGLICQVSTLDPKDQTFSQKPFVCTCKLESLNNRDYDDQTFLVDAYVDCTEPGCPFKSCATCAEQV